jgi:hypothetical protein
MTRLALLETCNENRFRVVVITPDGWHMKFAGNDFGHALRRALTVAAQTGLRLYIQLECGR